MPCRSRLVMLSLAALTGLTGCGAAAPEPSGHTVVSARLARAQQARLSTAVDALFADAKAGDTRAVVALRDGRIVAERYAAGTTAQTAQLGWSLSKCVTGLLVGLLVADGRLRLDAPAMVPAWQRAGDPRGAITPRMLLQMRSGLRHAELGKAGDAARMLRGDGHDDMATYATGEPLAAPAGRRSNYSSADTIVLADIAARTLAERDDPAARRDAVAGYLRTRLFAPAGMDSMTVGFDRRGTMIGSTLVWATPRDWAKLGELLRNNGMVRGAQLLPRSWIGFMRSPSPADPRMGAQLWRNARSADGGGDAALLPGKAPTGVFACAGTHGQFVIVSPAQRVTVVRMGASGDAGDGTLTRRLAAILRALPGYAGNARQR